MITEYVALLRGINVGGNNIVSMKSLKENFQQLGFTDVTTYINSGNVLFRSTAKDPRQLEIKIDDMLAREYGIKAATVVRSYAEMARLKKTIDANWKRVSADWRYYVVFLRAAIDTKDLLEGIVLKPDIEQVVYCPGTLLWRARISGLTRGGMMRLASQPVYKQMTVRNLNTTTKLCQLLERMRG